MIKVNSNDKGVNITTQQYNFADIGEICSYDYLIYKYTARAQLVS